MKGLGMIVFALVAVTGLRGDSGAEPGADVLAVRIVPTEFRERLGRSIESGRWHVVITNVSEKPIRLWREWCSWGYFCLSFEVTDEGGKTYTVKKKPRGWFANYPDSMMVPSRDHMVLEVSWDDMTWEGFPSPVEGKVQVLSMKAIYQVDAEDAVEHQVWTGRVASPAATYSFYR